MGVRGSFVILEFLRAQTSKAPCIWKIVKQLLDVSKCLDFGNHSSACGGL